VAAGLCACRKGLVAEEARQIHALVAALQRNAGLYLHTTLFGPAAGNGGRNGKHASDISSVGKVAA